MKQFIKLFGIAVITAAMLFSVTACGGDDPTTVPNAGDLWTSDSGIAFSWIRALAPGK